MCWWCDRNGLFCKEIPQHKDVEQKLTTIIIFFYSNTLKTVSYTHDDDGKTTKMCLFPRPRRPVADPPHREDPQKKEGLSLFVIVHCFFVG
ncbi:hypothetical protein AOY87_08435 [Escherichia coli]|nr:hypothetical protein AOY87_08435 [Escherichia coli]